MKPTILTMCAVTAMAVPAFAGSVSFDNPGFESGSGHNPTGWVLHSGDWESNGSQEVNNDHQNDSTVITNSSATDSNTLGQLREVLSGNDSFRLNNAANGAHFSTLTQSVTSYQGADLYFGFAAVLENPLSNPHTEAQTPKFSFSLMDNTTSTSLYEISFDSRNAVAQGITWHAGLDTNHDGSATWMFSDWNIVHIDTSLVLNHNLTLTVMAYDCALGGHGGYAYVDAFQASPITPNAGITNVNHLEASSLGAGDTAAVPETSTWVMGFMAVGAVFFMVRRSRVAVL